MTTTDSTNGSRSCRPKGKNTVSTSPKTSARRRIPKKSKPSDSRAVDVLFISMPFGPLISPSLGLSLLKACLTDSSITSEIKYFSFDYAMVCGFELYQNIASYYPAMECLPGDWVFSNVCSSERSLNNDELYIASVLNPFIDPAGADDFLGSLATMRADAEVFISQCADWVESKNPTLVGLTTMFQQTSASLALARELKRRCPDRVVVLGGSNCEGQMGKTLFQTFTYLDAVFSGYAEDVFVTFV